MISAKRNKASCYNITGYIDNNKLEYHMKWDIG